MPHLGNPEQFSTDREPKGKGKWRGNREPGLIVPFKQ